MRRLRPAWTCPLLLCLSASLSPAAGQVVTGRVMDDETGEAIGGAELVLLDPVGRIAGLTVSTDDGAFRLRAEERGWYRLRARRLGYATTTSAPLDLVESDSLKVEFLIPAEAIPLAPLTVVGPQRRSEPRDRRLEQGGYYDRKQFYGEESGFGRFLEGEDIRPTAFGIHDVLRHVPGIRLRPARGGARGEQTLVRGTAERGCAFFLDGMKTGRIDDIDPGTVAAIEVYPGMIAPGIYGGEGCVVAVWTGFREGSRR